MRLFGFLLFLISHRSVAVGKSDQNLIFILVDGFANHYLHTTPSFVGLDRIMRSGVVADSLTPEWPSLSFPNHYSMVTGLHIESHGLTGNHMWDPTTNQRFSQYRGDYLNSFWWNKTDPIWITAEQQNVRSAGYWWVACPVNFKGAEITKCLRYNQSSEDLGTILDEIVSDLAEKRSQLSLVFFKKVDRFGHQYGPNSHETRVAARLIDANLELLQIKLSLANLWQTTNLMVVSDHGMSVLDKKKLYYLDNCTELNLNDWVEHTLDRVALSLIYSYKQYEQLVYRALKSCFLPQHPNIQVFWRTDLPDRFHFKNARFLPEIIITTADGFGIITAMSGKQIPPYDALPIGIHGYDNNDARMKGIFLARGPSFKRGYRGSNVDMVDLYQLMTFILGIEGHSHNGSWDRMKDYLINSGAERISLSTSLFVTVCNYFVWKLLNC